MRALVLSGGGGRGAYELGVYKAFQERGHRFDILSGTSVGAITAAGIASGLSVDELEALWGRMHAFKVMQPRGDVWALHKWTHLVYSKPLLAFLEREIDYDALRASRIEVRVSAVDIATGGLRVFRNEELTPTRLLASASIPVLFPMVEDTDGRTYWDGGTVTNTPLRPAIEAGATEVTCVLVAPVGVAALAPPNNLWEAISRAADLRQMGHLQEDLKHAAFINRLVAQGSIHGAHHVDFHVVSPHTPLGITSILNFDAKKARLLMAVGHQDGSAFLDGRLREAPVDRALSRPGARLEQA